LWQVGEAGSLIIRFDLQYFFNVAENLSSKYKNLHSQEDIEAISAHDLLEISRRIGLLSDLSF
jgi:hypothetical protein